VRVTSEKKDSASDKKVQYWVGIAAGLTVPLGALFAAYWSTQYENRESVRSLVNQREQSET
jgi:hypothetical protein